MTPTGIIVGYADDCTFLIKGKRMDGDSIQGLDNQVRHLAAFVCDNPAKPTVPDIGEIMAYEDGDLDCEQTIDLFQRLINCGLAWKLQGHYGRTATRLIEAGGCTP